MGYTIHFDPRTPRSTDLSDAPVIDARLDGRIKRLHYYDNTECLRVPGREFGRYVQGYPQAPRRRPDSPIIDLETRPT